MKKVISTANMRESDAYTIANVTPSLDLMFRAAKSVYDSFDWNGKTIAIVCGSGNNAGDGYALSLILKEHGVSSKLLLIEEKWSNDGKYYFDKAVESGIENELISDNTSFKYDVIVDCLLGTGFKGTPRPNYASVIERINESNAYVISVDINSGLNGDNGLAEVAVKSNLTVSIGQYKYGHYLNEAMDYMEKKTNADIGIEPIRQDALLLEKDDVASIFEKRAHCSNKGDYGYVAIIGGSKRYVGAVKLANMGQTALYAGCGVSKLIVPDCIAPSLYSSALETTIVPLPTNEESMAFDEGMLFAAIKNVKAIAVGVGWGVSIDNQKTLEYLLSNIEIPLIIDADGINNLVEIGIDKLDSCKAKVVLTPHLKEFSRLCGHSVSDIKENPISYVKEFVNKYNVTLLLKGPTTIVADKENVYFVDRGAPGMATAGSGDVLTGILVGMFGYQNNNLTLVTACGAYINGLAGEIASSQYGDIAMVSSDTARCVSKAIHSLFS